MIALQQLCCARQGTVSAGNEQLCIHPNNFAYLFPTLHLAAISIHLLLVLDILCSWHSVARRHHGSPSTSGSSFA